MEFMQILNWRWKHEENVSEMSWQWHDASYWLLKKKTECVYILVFDFDTYTMYILWVQKKTEYDYILLFDFDK